MKTGKTPPISHSIGRSSFLLMALVTFILIATFNTSYGSYKLSGTVEYTSGEPVREGTVLVYRLHDIYRYPIFINADEVEHDGDYKVNLGNTRDTIYAIVINENEGEYVPTYYPSEIDWETAGDIIFPGTFPGGNNGKDIIVLSGSGGDNSSQNSITGDVNLGTMPAAYKDFGTKTFAYALKDGAILGYSQVSASGKYSIQSLPEGSYEVLVTGIGYKSQRTSVKLTGTTDKANVNFDLISGSSSSDKAANQTVKLSQNYPNPFNPATEIKFEIPENSLVKLQIFDAAGRQVALLVNTALNKGIHSVNFNASALTTGVYFYKLSAGSFTETKKMLLIK